LNQAAILNEERKVNISGWADSTLKINFPGWRKILKDGTFERIGLTSTKRKSIGRCRGRTSFDEVKADVESGLRIADSQAAIRRWGRSFGCGFFLCCLECRSSQSQIESPLPTETGSWGCAGRR
jgi:hypothetical protein